MARGKLDATLMDGHADGCVSRLANQFDIEQGWPTIWSRLLTYNVLGAAFRAVESLLTVFGVVSQFWLNLSLARFAGNHDPSPHPAAFRSPINKKRPRLHMDKATL
ncbi:hypothetical protein ACCD10_32260 [Pseudomonas sp. Pseusp122]|uniref:hypothetical protein n=1 Tax=unclassified Pseudomonas TaxID=196821 RepID=UPI0039A493E4